MILTSTHPVLSLLSRNQHDMKRMWSTNRLATEIPGIVKRAMTESETDTATETSTRTIEPLPPHYHWNFGAALVHGVFFLASNAFSSPTVVLPAFVALLTPSQIMVGLPMSIVLAGQILPQLFVAHFVEQRDHKKPLLVAAVAIRALSWALLATLTFFYGTSRPVLVLAALIAALTLFSVAGGMGLVVYADIIAKVFPANRRGRFYGTRYLLGNVLAFLAGLTVRAILGNEVRFPFPLSYAVLFFLAFISLAIAFTGVASIREPVESHQPKGRTFLQYLRRAIKLLGENPNFRRLIGVRLFLGASVLAFPFYVIYAREQLHVPTSALGIYISAQVVGEAGANMIWGMLGDRYGYKIVLALLAIVGGATPLVAMLVPASAGWAFVLVFVLMGATLTGVEMSTGNFLLEVTPSLVRPTCIALLNTLTAPLILFPLFGGWLIQRVASFGLMFWIVVATSLLAFILATGLRDPRHDPQGKCIVTD